MFAANKIFALAGLFSAGLAWPSPGWNVDNLMFGLVRLDCSVSRCGGGVAMDLDSYQFS